MEEDGDEGGPQKASKNDSAAPTGPSMGPLYSMWENSLEKLKVLNYETKFCAERGKKPFNRIHFVYPASNLSHQFDDFVELCGWLCAEISQNTDFFKKEQYDDPTTVANKLMLALRQLDFRASFPAVKLKTPHGEPVCLVLDFLTDSALASRGFKWGAPIYHDGDEVEQPEMDDDLEADVEDDGGVEEEGLFDAVDRAELSEASLDNSAHQILQPAIDPIEWKTELERVGPKLRTQHQLPTNEWRAHVDQTVVSRELIDKVVGDANGDLNLMNKAVSEELTRISTKEKYLNNQFTALCLEYKEIRSVQEQLEAKSAAANETVAKLTNSLNEVTERFDELKENFESKDSGMTDTSPLVRMKASLQQIKAEVMSFDLRIGVVAHSLLVARVNAANTRRIGQANKARQRRAKGGRNKDVADDDSLISADD